jgi:hypothetical protein
MKMPPGMKNRLGTEAAEGKDQDDALDGFHLVTSTFGPKSRWLF